MEDGNDRSSPTVSIIVPVYNAEQALQRCVDSILGQEYTDFEVLLFDDGSRDTSGAIGYARLQQKLKENTVQILR